MEHRILCIVRWKLLLLSAIIPVALVNSSSLEPHRHSKREFVSSPKDQVVLRGEQVRLECRTDLTDPMTWHFFPSNGSSYEDIYYSETFVQAMQDKYQYQLDTSRTGQYTLVIPSVDTKHAGQYRCDEDEGFVKGKPVELTVLERLPACTVRSSNPNNVICSFEAAGSLDPKITCGREARQPERKINVYSFTEKFDPKNTRPCRVCFTKGTTGGCVFETGFEVILESLEKTTLSGMLETHNAKPQIQPEEAGNGKIVVAVIMIVIGVVIIAAIVVVAIKRKALRERIIEYRDQRRRMTQDLENQDGTGTALNDNQRNGFRMSPSLSTESGNSETPLNPNGRDA